MMSYFLQRVKQMSYTAFYSIVTIPNNCDNRDNRAGCTGLTQSSPGARIGPRLFSADWKLFSKTCPSFRIFVIPYYVLPTFVIGNCFQICPSFRIYVIPYSEFRITYFVINQIKLYSITLDDELTSNSF